METVAVRGITRPSSQENLTGNKYFYDLHTSGDTGLFGIKKAAQTNC